MIQKIIIKNAATFDERGVEIDNLKKINFIYGANGCGKTTISNVIASPELYTDSSIVCSSDNNEDVLYIIKHSVKKILVRISQEYSLWAKQLKNK